MADFEWKQVAVTTHITQAQWDEMNLARRVPVREPWYRRALIRVGLARQRYRTEDLSWLMYGDHAGPTPKEFAGLASLVKAK